jgi:UDP-N-acetylmuramate--alanine ligase
MTVQDSALPRRGEILGGARGGRVDVASDTRFHLVGIGGAGLSAIARVLLERGYRVSGSDLAPSDLAPGEVTAALRELGATVYAGHAADQVAGADVLLVSSAVLPGNVEVDEALRQEIPVLKRSEFLGWLTANKQTVAVSGTHGKTTTTGMIAWILSDAGLDPSYIIGGTLPQLHGSAHAGGGEVFVIEADEYDRAFLGLRPRIAVVTIVEWDHVDCYPACADFQAAFREFAALVPRSGLLVVCADDPYAAELGVRRQAEGLPVLSYGLGSQGDWQARDTEINARGGNDFDAWYRGEKKGAVSLQVAGLHNVLNSLAAVAVANYLDVRFDRAADAVGRFAGAKRRFERKGDHWGVLVLDDYAHHPTEVRATLSAARQLFPQRTVWAVMQPHTYSRTKALLQQFAASFADADHVVITDIYPARERDTLGVSALHIVDTANHPDIRYIGGLRAAADCLLQWLQPGDVVLTMGAGDGYKVGEWVLEGLREREDAQRVAQATA